MNYKKISYCPKCKKLGVSHFSVDGGRTENCACCRNRIRLIDCTTVVDGTLVVVGDLPGRYAIPEGVREIYLDTMSGTSIQQLTLPNTLKNISYHCFSKCRHLEEITIPRGVTQVEIDAFADCTGLKKVTILGNTRIHSGAFNRCDQIETVVVGGDLGDTWKDGTPFDSCRKLESITFLPTARMETINLSHIPNLKQVALLCPVQRTNGASGQPGIRFFRCERLERVEIAQVETLGNYTFGGCTALREVIFQSPVKRIEPFAFNLCASLQSITVGEGCEEMGGFGRCEKLREITIPRSTKIIGANAFCGSGLESVVIPEGVKVIGEGAFSDCANLRHVELPSTISKIDYCAFHNCTDLETIIIPEGVEEIDDEAFAECEKLRCVKLPSTLKTIGEYAFRSVPIRIAKLPKSVKKRSEDAFEPEVTISTVNGGGYLLKAEQVDGVAYVLKAKTQKIQVTEGVEVVAAHAAEPGKVKTIQLPESVTEVCEGAFAQCTDVQTVTFGSNLRRIGSRAFAGVTGQLVDLPASVTELAPDAFGPGCLLSIGGEMPMYAVRQAELAKNWQTIATKQENLTQQEALLVTLQETLAATEANEPPECAQIPQVQQQLNEIRSKRDAHAEAGARMRSQKAQQAQALTRELEELQQQRKQCSFLAVSRKKALQAQIQEKESALTDLEAQILQLNQVLQEQTQEFDQEAKPVEWTLFKLQQVQIKWNASKQEQSQRIQELRHSCGVKRREMEDLEAKTRQQQRELEEAHSQWLAARNVALGKQKEQKEKEKADAKRKKLETEKKKLLSQMVPPKKEEAPGFVIPAGATQDETVLNQALLDAMVAWQRQQDAERYNAFCVEMQPVAQRVRQINELLGLRETDGLPDDRLVEVPVVGKDLLPENFSKANAYFAKADPWKTFRESLKVRKPETKHKTWLRDRFFHNCDYLCFDGKGYCLVCLPGCMVVFSGEKAMRILHYGDADLKVEYVEETTPADKIPEFGELIRQHHLHLNADGSPSKRYKVNPLMQTVRYSKIVISQGKHSISLPMETYAAALTWETAFRQYGRWLTVGQDRDVYAMFRQNATWEQMHCTIENLSQAEKQQKQLEVQRQKEEQQRIQAQRQAEQAAAEEKRKALIRQQRERNAQRRLEAEQKQKIYQLFEDTPEETVAEETKTAAPAAPLEVVGDRMLSNNVCKIRLRQQATFPAGEATCYFVAADGSVISNKKKMDNVGIGQESILGFILLPGIDYTKMKTCYLQVESQGTILGQVEFRMNISFCSDF